MIPLNIKILIENRFGRKIVYSKDCEALAISIKRVCNKPISATTLKRIFGFAKNIDRPRLYTLDTIANYLNFADWGSLLNVTCNAQNRLQVLPSDSTHIIQQQLLHMLMTGIIDIQKVEALCVKFGTCDEIINYIIDLVMFATKSKNMMFLKHIFDLPVIYDSIISDPKLLDVRLYFIGQSVGMALRSDNSMAKELTKIYGDNRVAQVILIEWFVDEDYINGYYSKLLETYYKNKKQTNETNIFYYALKYTGANQLNNQIKQKYWANKISKINISEDYHPILIGRYLGICLAENVNITLEKGLDSFDFILKLFKKYTYIQKAYLGLFALRYLFASKNKKHFIILSEILEKELKKDKLTEKDFWRLKIDNQLLIYLGYSKYLTNSLKTANTYIHKIDLNLFDVFRYRSLHKDFSDVQSLLKK